MTEQEEEAEQTRHGAEEGFRTEAGGSGDLYSAHVYMLQGKQRHQDKKCGHLPSTAFVRKQRPAYVKEFSEKQRVRSGVASMCVSSRVCAHGHGRAAGG